MLQINLADNDIGGYYDDENELISTPEGPKAIADAMRVSRSLTQVLAVVLPFEICFAHF